MLHNGFVIGKIAYHALRLDTGQLMRAADNGTTFDNVTNHPVVNGQFMDVAFSE